jgi:hypothetical protein
VRASPRRLLLVQSDITLVLSERRNEWGVNQQSPTFTADIRPLFRDSDIEEMSWSFDLASYDEVRDNAEAIYERLSDGSMPCDEPWPDERVATFRAWMDAGAPV